VGRQTVRAASKSVTNPNDDERAPYGATLVGSLQAEHLKSGLAMVEAKTSLRCTRWTKKIGSKFDPFNALIDYRVRVEIQKPKHGNRAFILTAVTASSQHLPPNL
jgi:hypothetical protein